MDEYLYKYLVLHKKLNIPHVGSFAVKDQPARMEGGILYPPQMDIVFDESGGAASDRLFFDFLAEEMGVDDITAIKAFTIYSGRIRDDIQKQENTPLRGIGFFTKDAEGNPVFTSEKTGADFFQSIPVDEELMEMTPTTEKTDPYWWYYAIILLILGIGALLYYYV